MSFSSPYERPEVIAQYAAMQDLQPAERILFDRYLTEARSLLDLGVGAGRTTQFLLHDRRYVGLDSSQGMIDACQERFPGAEFRVGDAADLSWCPDASFDAVLFSFNGIDYLKPDRHRQACLEEVARVLRPGHPFIFSRHDPWGGWGRRRVLRAARLWRGAGYAHDPSHGGMDTHFATPEYVTRELARSGLNVVDVLRAGRGRRPPWWYYAALRAP